MRNHIFVLCFVLTIGLIDFSNGDCVPRPGGFQWNLRKCPNQQGSPKINLKKVFAFQNGQRVTSVDIDSPLTLKFEIDYKYGKPIQNNRFDIKLLHYMDNGEGCRWETEDTGNVLNNIDACSLISDNCAYNGNPTSVTYVINFKKVLGSLADMTVPGNYYAFEINQRDGRTFLSCLTLQSQVQ